MIKTVNALAKSFVNILFPLHCSGCNSPIEAVNEYSVCRPCVEKIRPGPEGHGEETKGTLFTKAYSACLYEGIIKDLIHQFKYKRKLGLSRIFTVLMAEFVKKNPSVTTGIDLITFVPLHAKRLRVREFNQSKVMAAGLSRQLGMPIEETLEKHLATRHQFELSREERLTNLKGAFRVRNGIRLSGLKILLIDDVMTTGSTLNECSRVLLDGGAKEVRCLVLARGV